MNDQIKQLYQQAHVTVTRQERKGGWDNDREPFEYRTVTETVFDPSRFAALVVQECVEQCDQVAAEANAMAQSKFVTDAGRMLHEGAWGGALNCSGRIQKHFGFLNE
jgi:hypothetical protein